MSLDGNFWGSFHVHQRVKAKTGQGTKQMCRKVTESGVNLNFKPDKEKGTLTVRGKGANEFGAFELYGKARRNTPSDGKGTAPTYSVFLYKKYTEDAPLSFLLERAKKANADASNEKKKRKQDAADGLIALADGPAKKKGKAKSASRVPMEPLSDESDEMLRIKREDTDDEGNENDRVFLKIVYPTGCEHEEEMIELYRSEYITFADVRRGIIEQGIDVPFATFRFLVEAGGASITPTQEEKWKVRKFDLMKDGAEMDGTFHRPYHIFVKEHHSEAAVP
ncbi:hypothetical protein ACHAXT_002746 [Thalassiosira profunda]